MIKDDKDGLIWNEGGELPKALDHAVEAFKRRFNREPETIELHIGRAKELKLDEFRGAKLRMVRHLLTNDLFVRG